MRLDFVSQLSMSVRPLGMMTRFDKTTPRQLAHLADNHAKQTQKAIDLYEKVLKPMGWVTTKKLEWALGYADTNCTAFLRKLQELGHVESRPKGGAAVYVRNRGREWKWKENGMTPEMKNWIDGASYEELLKKWDSDPTDSPIYNPQYAVSVYYVKAMKRKAGELNVTTLNEIKARLSRKPT